MARTRDQVFAAGQNIQHCLSASETSLDTGLIAQLHLAAALLNARLELGFAPQFQRDLVADAGRVVVEGLAQRERTISLHERLAELATKFGMDPQSFGDGGDKDAPDAMPFHPARGLRLVVEA